MIADSWDTMDLFSSLVGDTDAQRVRHESLRDMMHWPEAEFILRGLSARNAFRLMAALSLGKRAVSETPRRATVSTSAEAVDLLQHLSLEETEVFVVLALDMKNRVLQEIPIASGSLNACVLVPRDVFRAVVRAGAAHMILAHNHPSGDPAPSREDARLTQYVARAGEILGIDLLDHVIIGHGRHFSFRDSGMLGETQPRRLAAC